jgi:Tellurite resistance protein TerB
MIDGDETSEKDAGNGGGPVARRPLTPDFAFAVSLLYCMRADSVLDPREVGHLVTMLGEEALDPDAQVAAATGGQRPGRSLAGDAMHYVRTVPVERFLAEAVPLLTEAQRLCIVLNMLDSAAADGVLSRAELELVLQFQRAFAISPNRFRPMLHAIATKNDRAVLFRADHPRNRGRPRGRPPTAVSAARVH